MWKLVPLFSRRLVQKANSFRTVPVRYFLSESFKLETTWNDRLQSPILKRININDLFLELDHQFQHFAFASALDIDLFVNAVDDDSGFDEVEDVVHKLRLSPEAINILPSTQHALIRLFMKWNKTKDLIRILDDRLNYGVFSDDYCTLLMMDTFIKEGNYRDAAKISTLGMLQEDVANPLIKYMSLYSCHKYLENPVPWKEEDNEEVEDDDEEVKVRVRFIKNPYFDDHFDLVNPNHLIGKTLTLIGKEINDHIGRTYHLIGLLLHDKLKLAKDYLQSLSTENCTMLKDGLNMAKNILDEKSKSEGRDDAYIALVNELKELLNKSLSDSQLSVEGNLLDVVKGRLKDLVSKNETDEINKQMQLYEEWEKKREKLLIQQIAKINREKQLAEVQRQKQLLQEKEEELYFFDNEDQFDLMIEEKEKKKEEQIQKVLDKKKLLPFVAKSRKPERIKKEFPPLESFFDENIPMKLVKTKQ